MKFFLAVFCVFTFVGCAPENKELDQNPVYVGRNWTVNDVSLDCEDNSLCPDNQGVLLVVKRVTEYNYFYSQTRTSVFRCTGTIYDLHKAILAGHCVTDLAGADEIWFKTIAKPGKPSRLFHVSSKPIDATSPHKDFWLLDYGAIELKEAATGIEFAHPALKVPVDTHEMVALVVNAKNSNGGIDTKYILNAVSCKHGVSPLNPVTYEQNPTMFLVTDCKLYGGNSGGALVLRDDPLAILGIASASNNANPKNPNIYNPNARDASTHVDQGIFTNARCIAMPSWPKVEASCLEMSDVRVKEAIELQKRNREQAQQELKSQPEVAPN
ncbi:MAG: S1 family peptidase [Bdellovibrionales bacterium]